MSTSTIFEDPGQFCDMVAYLQCTSCSDRSELKEEQISVSFVLEYEHHAFFLQDMFKKFRNLFCPDDIFQRYVKSEAIMKPRKKKKRKWSSGTIKSEKGIFQSCTNKACL